MFANIPTVKPGVIAVSRSCFPAALSERRRAALVSAYGEGLYECPVIVENEPMEETCRRFIDYVIKVASGELTNNEKKGYREIAIFKNGVTL